MRRKIFHLQALLHQNLLSLSSSLFFSLFIYLFLSLTPGLSLASHSLCCGNEGKKNETFLRFKCFKISILIWSRLNKIMPRSNKHPTPTLNARQISPTAHLIFARLNETCTLFEQSTDRFNLDCPSSWTTFTSNDTWRCHSRSNEYMVRSNKIPQLWSKSLFFSRARLELLCGDSLFFERTWSLFEQHYANSNI